MTNKKVKLNLANIDSNAFSLLGAFTRQAKKENWDSKEIKEVVDDMTSGDYDHLVQVIMKYSEEDEDNIAGDQE